MQIIILVSFDVYLHALCFATQVPLGIILKNENKGDEMVDIMSNLHQYVPAAEYTTSVTVPGTEETVLLQHAAFHKIFVGGDQLTAARARSSQKAMANSVSPRRSLGGLIPCAEDWHTKLNLLGVS